MFNNKPDNKPIDEQANGPAHEENDKYKKLMYIAVILIIVYFLWCYWHNNSSCLTVPDLSNIIGGPKLALPSVVDPVGSTISPASSTIGTLDLRSTVAK